MLVAGRPRGWPARRRDGDALHRVVGVVHGGVPPAADQREHRPVLPQDAGPQVADAPPRRVLDQEVQEVGPEPAPPRLGDGQRELGVAIGKEVVAGVRHDLSLIRDGDQPDPAAIRCADEALDEGPVGPNRGEEAEASVLAGQRLVETRQPFDVVGHRASHCKHPSARQGDRDLDIGVVRERPAPLLWPSSSPGLLSRPWPAIDDWWNTNARGHYSLLLAGTRAEVAALNRLAHERAGAQGQLTGAPLTVGGSEFQVGQRVVCTRNARGTATGVGSSTIDNGTIGIVTAVHHDTHAITITTLGQHREIELDTNYVASGHVQHGYALTIHKAQGTTCDYVHVVGPTGLYREAAYVALSRARHGADHLRHVEPGFNPGQPVALHRIAPTRRRSRS